jgi:CheY-like chemotaxis protein
MTGALVLIVEDNDKNRKLVRDVLTFKGYEVIESETGEEGVRLARERSPSLVLMDIRLPGDRQKILEAGFDGYQSKPIDLQNFVAAVAQLLERRRT